MKPLVSQLVSILVSFSEGYAFSKTLEALETGFNFDRSSAKAISQPAELGGV